MLQAALILLLPVSFGVVLRQVRYLQNDGLSKLVIFMIWGRFAVTSLGELAVKTTIAGFSLVALSTIILTAIGLLSTPLSLFRSKWVQPFYAIIGIGTLSGVLNGRASELVAYAVTWCFFLVIALLLFRAFEKQGFKVVLSCLIAVFLLPLAGQFLSFILRAPKIGPDGSLSYIGAYGHEAVFAIVLLAALFVMSAYPWKKTNMRVAVFLAVISGFFLANYRTSIIAAMPMVFVFLLQFSATRKIMLRRVALISVLAVLLIPEVAPRIFGDRFDEIGALSDNFGYLLKPPEEFTANEKDILSARAYIWSSYLYGSIRADTPQLLVGHGPGSIAPELSVHAHNEFLRILFEFGIVGLLLWLGVFIRQVIHVFRSEDVAGRNLILAGFASVCLGSLGTAFFNRPEGMILIALLCSSTWYFANRH